VLPDLDGKTVDLKNFRGRDMALVFWNPGCGFCTQMVEDLKAWERSAPAGAPQLVLVSSGDPEANRALGLRAPILMEPNFGVGRLFGASGTPSAVLIDAQGKVASEVVPGGPAVLALLADAGASAKTAPVA